MQIFVHKTGLMHAMSTAAAKGYCHHCTGIIRPENAVKFAERRRLLDFTDLTPVQRTRAKKAGQAGARLFMHPDYQQLGFHWWLMLTEGEHPARSREKIRDHTERQRLTVFNQFEAVRLPKDGEDAEPWTWRLTRQYFNNQKAAISEIVHRRGEGAPRELAAFMEAINRLPGFRGIREEVKALRGFLIAEWKRTKGRSSVPPIPEIQQGWVRFKSFKTVDLELVVARMLAGDPPFDDAWRYPQHEQQATEAD